MTVAKPIFIVGAGRSGTTLLYRLLATHPEVCWFSTYTNKRPGSRLAPLRHRVLDLPVVGTNLKRDIIRSSRPRSPIRPAEADRIYLDHCGFEEDRKTTENDLTPGMEEKFRTLVERHLCLTGKKRFLSKQTSNVQRLRIIHHMFPDAYCVHATRDGRAVANSLHAVDWWENLRLWWLGMTPAEWKNKNKEKDSIELCALHWMRNVEEIRAHKPLFGDRYIEVDYENLTGDVRGTLERVTDFCGLKRASKFRNLLPETFPSQNHKWKERLTEPRKQILDDTIAEFENRSE